MCALTLAAFFVNIFAYELAWASKVPTQDVSDGRLSSIHSIDKFTLPSYLGYVKDSFNGKSGKIVFHIQDAHCNYAAQKAIYSILDYLHNNYNVTTVNLEGGEGDYDLSPFAKVNDAALKGDTADYFLKEGLINGAELYSINIPGNTALWGVENTDIYLDNLKIYRESLVYKKDIDESLKSISFILGALKAGIYSKRLLDLDRKSEAFRKRKVELKEYILYLNSFADSEKLSATDLKNLVIMAKVIELEKRIDFKRSNVEREQLIDKLTKSLSKNEKEELVKEAVEFKLNHLIPAEFYEYLVNKAKELELDLAIYANLMIYIDYIKLYAGLKNEEIFREIDILEKRIKEKLYQNSAQRRLDKLSGELDIIKKVFSISLTSDEYSYFQSQRKEFDIDNFIQFIENEAPRYAVNIDALPEPSFINARLAEIERFYELSRKRDLEFVKNIRFDGQENKRQSHNGQYPIRNTVLITGGFHTENLAKLLKEKDVSYISIMPNFGIDNKECPYFKLLSGNNAGLMKFITVGISNIALYSYFCGKNSEKVYGIGQPVISDLPKTVAKFVHNGEAAGVSAGAIKARQKTIVVTQNKKLRGERYQLNRSLGHILREHGAQNIGTAADGVIKMYYPEGFKEPQISSWINQAWARAYSMRHLPGGADLDIWQGDGKGKETLVSYFQDKPSGKLVRMVIAVGTDSGMENMIYTAYPTVGPGVTYYKGATRQYVAELPLSPKGEYVINRKSGQRIKVLWGDLSTGLRAMLQSELLNVKSGFPIVQKEQLVWLLAREGELCNLEDPNYRYYKYSLPQGLAAWRDLLKKRLTDNAIYLKVGKENNEALELLPALPAHRASASGDSPLILNAPEFITITGDEGAYKYLNPAFLPDGSLVTRCVRKYIDTSKLHHSMIARLVPDPADAEGLNFKFDRIIMDDAEDPRVMNLGKYGWGMTFTRPSQDDGTFKSYFVRIEEDGSIAKDSEPIKLGNPNVNSKDAYIVVLDNGKAILIDRANVPDPDVVPAIQMYGFDSLEELLRDKEDGYWDKHTVKDNTVKILSESHDGHVGFNTMVGKVKYNDHRGNAKEAYLAFIHRAKGDSEKNKMYKTAAVLFTTDTFEPLGVPVDIHAPSELFKGDVCGVIYETAASIKGDDLSTYAGYCDSNIVHYNESVN
ncbi:MAG: hypothetical protein Q7S30_00880, partial [Candidatus Omnitrophota bacterium]|nr:hypothetical protein [Candidatus Omnitrophota bacterium]